MLIRPDLVLRAAKQIRARMAAIIRLAKNDSKIDEGVSKEARKFLEDYFGKYLLNNYFDMDNARFKISE